jgi:hypothetical protein
MKRSRSILLLVFCLILPGPLRALQAPRVAVDPRIELLTIVFRLAGNAEYSQCQFPAYSRAINEWFAPWKDHEAVQIARELRNRYGIGYDAPINLAIHLGPLPDLKERVPLGEGTLTLEERWRRYGTAPFLAALRHFAKETRFTEFMAQEAPLADTTAARMQALIDQQIDFSWFAEFFGARPEARLLVAPGLCNGGANYGPRVRTADGAEELYAVIGVSGVDTAGLPRFDRSFATTLIHEFSHSFVNPVLDRNRDRFATSVPRVFVSVTEDMRSLAYGAWPTTLAESLVRASVVRYLASRVGPDAAKQELATQQGLGFIWMNELSDLFAKYERERRKYPTFESYLPRVVAYYDGLSDRMDQVVKAYAATQPRVVDSTPPNQSNEVDPSTSEITIRFDRPMTGGYSINYGAGGAATYPDVLGLTFDPTGTVFILRVRLEPDRDYEMTFTGAAFRSRDGVSLGRHELRFRTGASRAPAQGTGRGS